MCFDLSKVRYLNVHTNVDTQTVHVYIEVCWWKSHARKFTNTPMYATSPIKPTGFKN